MTQEEIAKAIKERPYEHCETCELNAKHGGRCCHVADKYQRLPKELYRGALGMCIKIGGRGEMTGMEAELQKRMDADSLLRKDSRKQAILDKLCETLQLTDGAWDVQSMVYRNFGPDSQVVDVEWQAGHHKLINVSGDSDTAMVRDVMEHLGC